MTEPMTQQELDAIDAAEKAATPGMWENVKVKWGNGTYHRVDYPGYAMGCGTAADAAFIALSRTAVPRMRGEIDRLKALVEQERRRAEAAETNREEFMQIVYEELESDPNNDRANRIIDAYDMLTTPCADNTKEATHAD